MMRGEMRGIEFLCPSSSSTEDGGRRYSRKSASAGPGLRVRQDDNQSINR